MNIVTIIKFSLIYSSNNDIANRESWFAFRANLFEKTLLKSILDNSVHPNLIMLGFDVNDSKLVEKYIQPLLHHTELKFIEIYSDNSNFGKAVTSKLLKRYKDQPLLLTRIDSDDIISKDYYQVFLDYAYKINENQKYIVAADGLRTNLKIIMSVYDENPPFLALMVRNYNGEYLNVTHSEIHKKKPTIIRKRFLWIQLVHGTNQLNSMPSKFDYVYIKIKRLIKFFFFPTKDTFYNYDYANFFDESTKLNSFSLTNRLDLKEIIDDYISCKLDN